MHIDPLMIARSKQSSSGFSVEGPYGVVTAWPEQTGLQGAEGHYWVDALYFGDDQHPQQHSRQKGFRLSTVWCLCEGICYGEKNLDSRTIAEINALF